MNLYKGLFTDVWNDLDYWTDRGRNNIDFITRVILGLIAAAVVGVLLFMPSLFIWFYQLVRWLFVRRVPNYTLNKKALKSVKGGNHEEV